MGDSSLLQNSVRSTSLRHNMNPPKSFHFFLCPSEFFQTAECIKSGPRNGQAFRDHLPEQDYRFRHPAETPASAAPGCWGWERGVPDGRSRAPPHDRIDACVTLRQEVATGIVQEVRLRLPAPHCSTPSQGSRHIVTLASFSAPQLTLNPLHEGHLVVVRIAVVHGGPYFRHGLLISFRWPRGF